MSSPFFNQVADNFVLTSGANTITDVHWWGVYGNTGTRTGSDDFTSRFFEDVLGLPGASPFLEMPIGDAGGTFTGDFLAGLGSRLKCSSTRPLSPLSH